MAIWIRLLMAMAVLQTIGVVMLLTRWSDDEPTSTLEVRLQETLAKALSSCSGGADRLASLPDEDRLRGILREEFARQPQARVDEHVTAPTAVAAKPRDDAAARLQRELVTHDVQSYISRGSITDRQLNDLQAQMATLDAKTRRQLMSRLIKAMSSGDLEHEF